MNDEDNPNKGCAGMILAAAIGIVLILWAAQGFPGVAK